MPSTISMMSVVAIGCATSLGASWSDSGYSDEAGFLRESASTLTGHAEKSQFLFGEKADAIERLWAIYQECSNAQWDGDEAVPLMPEALARAEAFIRALPPDIPMPDITPEPDGAIALEWRRSRWQMISMSFGLGDPLPYAWLDGAERGHAVGLFARDVISTRLLDAIRANFDHGPAIRAA